MLGWSRIFQKPWDLHLNSELTEKLPLPWTVCFNSYLHSEIFILHRSYFCLDFLNFRSWILTYLLNYLLKTGANILIPDFLTSVMVTESLVCIWYLYLWSQDEAVTTVKPWIMLCVFDARRFLCCCLPGWVLFLSPFLSTPMTINSLSLNLQVSAFLTPLCSHLSILQNEVKPVLEMHNSFALNYKTLPCRPLEVMRWLPLWYWKKFVCDASITTALFFPSDNFCVEYKYSFSCHSGY